MEPSILYIIFSIIEIMLMFMELFFITIFISLAIYQVKTGVPFVKSKKILINRIKEANILKDNTIFCDLGSGDGSFLYQLAKEFPQVQFVGYEINIFLYIFSKLFNRLPNLKFYHRDFFKVDLSSFDYIYVFLLSSLMEQLVPKIQKEAKKGCYVIVNTFAFKNLQPIKEISSTKPLETLYFYQL
ncbi:MAG TPA: methyltransferase domain-containing protein [Candidatus Paceibacterota bacterium]|nr:methyltransferase domain-containing protein [Candidatus Paceibacterota bacterium]HOL53969.1 methyltransferase domain-containing protein [Candidatus Paceibacterota bacterium]HPP16870.1 methyltransferase domain-containing protein [Candidatus Paceibacterota bacterium]